MVYHRVAPRCKRKRRLDEVRHTGEVETHGVAEGYACVLHRLRRVSALLHAATLWLSDDMDDWTAANDTIYSFTSPYGLKQLQYPSKTPPAIPNHREGKN